MTVTLLRWLQTSFSLDGTIISWFTPYLFRRTQYVRSKGTSSTPSMVLFGVPQASVLGPILFLLYNTHLIQLANYHHLHPHVYANDTQIYGLRNPADVDILQERVFVCVDDWRHGCRLTGCSLIPPRLKCGGVRLHGVNIRSRSCQYVSATRLCCQYHLYGTLGSMSMPTSPWLLTSTLLLQPVSQHCGRYEACNVYCQMTLCWRWFKHSSSAKLTATTQCWLGSLDHSFIDSNQCWMPLLGWCSQQGSQNTWLHLFNKSDIWHHPVQLQACSGPSTAEKGWTRRQWSKEFQASLKSVISLEIIGEDSTEETSGFPR